jgi:sporulation protein YlmC with PRC-barrel domain
MRDFSKWAVLLSLIVLPIAGFAQDQATVPEAGQGMPAADDSMRRMSELIGKQIALTGDDLQGSVHDIVISGDGNLTHLVADVSRVPAAVEPGTAADQTAQPGIDPGAAVAVESNRFVVPVEQFTFGTREEAISLNLGWDDLQGFPTLSDDQLPADLGVAAGAGEAVYYLGRDLRDCKFVNMAGDDLGSTSDIMLDLGQKKVAYFAMASGGFLGIGEKLVAVSMSSISDINIGEKQLLVNLTKEQLEEMEGFDKGNWPTAAADFGSAPSSTDTDTTEQQAPAPSY